MISAVVQRGGMMSERTCCHAVSHLLLPVDNEVGKGGQG